MELSEFLKNIKGKILIAGIGNPLRGDDAVGSYIIKRLVNDRINAVLVDCEDQLERFIEKIIQHKPETIIFIDALHMNQKPGSVAFLTEENLENIRVSTHQGNLSMCIKYIKARIKTKVFIIGIQPENTDFGKPISEKVLNTAETLRSILLSNIK
ncbi:MAG: hydrogenase 3 maturation endopeptidase HyCI [Thermodesulfovibrio sp.]|nr:hydrogenase 3 maturation endopeptidase HyCI [Thermodesulfovibrio sp.]MCX7724550.1 hydrogenase 3 maturation endopeptidase HyCI [Thermodesulfovibrio sp.]MDW7972478.1 hydrogenase 3 maturation endopeptidase HyCI [Thermodesulfovibrio sp.]